MLTQEFVFVALCNTCSFIQITPFAIRHPDDCP